MKNLFLSLAIITLLTTVSQSLTTSTHESSGINSLQHQSTADGTINLQYDHSKRRMTGQIHAVRIMRPLNNSK